MAKFEDPLKKLRALTEEEAAEPLKQRSGKGRFDLPFGQVTAKDVAKATQDRSMAGQYKRKTINLPPEQVKYIRQIAKQEGMGLLETYRWLIDLAIRHYETGEHPEIEGRTERLVARKTHWSSQL